MQRVSKVTKRETPQHAMFYTEEEKEEDKCEGLLAESAWKVESLTAKFELRSASLLEEELLTTAVTKWIALALERISTLRFGVIGIVAIVEPCPEFRIR